MEGKTVYLKKVATKALIFFECVNDRLNISFSTTGECKIDNDSYMTADWLKERDYIEISRTEFMEAYLPIAEKMNNKIGEL